MKSITNSMVSDFNSTLNFADSPLRIYYDKDFNGYQIKLYNLRDIKSYIIVPSDDFYEALENHFKKEGIELRYNADKTVFWSK